MNTIRYNQSTTATRRVTVLGMTSLTHAGTASAVRPVSMPLLDRIASVVITTVPAIMVAIGMWFGWSGNLVD